MNFWRILTCCGTATGGAEPIRNSEEFLILFNAVCIWHIQPGVKDGAPQTFILIHFGVLFIFSTVLIFFLALKKKKRKLCKSLKLSFSCLNRNRRKVQEDELS